MTLELLQVLISSGILGTAIWCLIKLGRILEKMDIHDEQITHLWKAHADTTARLFQLTERRH